MAANAEVGKLTQPQLVRLACNITPDDAETLGLGYLEVKPAEVKTLKSKHRENTEAFKRDIITRWTNEPSNKGPQQVQVGLHPFTHKAHGPVWCNILWPGFELPKPGQTVQTGCAKSIYGLST